MKKLVLALVALAAAVAVATPALADFNFYGSMRLKTNYIVTDDTPARSSDSSALALQANSRFGANATTGDLGGRVELGLRDAVAGQGYNTYTRLIYGTWKTDMGTLLIGQTYMPYWTAYAMVYKDDDGFNGKGELYEGRTPTIKYDFASGLYVAAIQNKATGVANAKTLLPKLNVGFKNKAGNLSYNAGVAYQVYDQYYGAGFATAAAAQPDLGGVAGAAAIPVTDNKRQIVSYLAYLELTSKTDAFAFTTKLHYGQNLKEFGFARDKSYAAASNDNTESYGGVAQVTVGMVNAGLSYTVDDTHALGANGKANKDVAAFVNAVIKPAKGFSITPEVAYYDNNVRAFDWDDADEVAATIKWQMDF